MAWMRAMIVSALLAMPTVLGFFAGGFFDRPRLWAGLGAAVLVAAVAVVCPWPWPRRRSSWLAIGGLAALTAWAGVSTGWTPVRDVAQADVERLLLYLAVLVAGIAAFRARAAARAVEPALALGAVLLVAEGISERLLPGLITLTHSQGVSGRLYQPLTYWNAMGLVAAMGAVLCVRIAGDATRARWMRVAAGVATPLLGLGLYLTLSRGAVLALAVGLVLLAMLEPNRTQLRTMAMLAAASAPGVIFAALVPGIRTLEGALSSRETEGLAMLAVLVVAGLAAGGAVGLEYRGRASTSREPSPRARRAARGAGAAMAVAVVTIFGVLAEQRHTAIVNPTQKATTARLATDDSNRGDFWRVARHAFLRHPVRGVGAGGFRVEWLRHRPIPYAVQDAHSLYFQTLAELGIVGALCLAALFVGVGASAVRARRRDPGLAVGWIAVVGMWAVHAGFDWDWEMPAVSLVALLLAAALMARSEEAPTVGRIAEAAPDTPSMSEAAPAELHR